MMGHDDTQHIVISVDSALMELLIAIHMDLQAANTAHTLAIRAEAITEHLTSVTAQLQTLTKPTPGE